MKINFFKFYRLFLAAVPLAIAIFLVYKNFFSLIEIQAQLTKDSPAMSMLGPEPRVRQTNSGAEILDSPVYFDLRTMPWQNNAEIKIIYKENGRMLEALGIKTGPQWQYLLNKNFTKKEAGDGFFESEFRFDLNDAYGEKNIKRMIISTNGYSGQALTIKSLIITVK